MKLNKIISTVAAISMLGSLSFTTVNAAHATNPMIHVYVTEAADIESKTYYKIPEGYTPYMVSYSIEGIDTSLNSINGLAISYSLSEEDLAKVHTKSFSKSKTNGAVSGRDLNGVYADSTGSLQLISKQQLSFANTEGIDITDWDKYPAGSADESLRFLDTLWYVKTGESVTINYTSEVATGGQTSSKIELDDASVFTSDIRFAPSNAITLGKAADVPVESITLNKDDITLDLNGVATETLIATVLPVDATDPTVTWESDKPEIATVDGGKVTAVAEGEAKITATAGGKTATCKVTVKDTTPPAKPIVDVTPSEITGDYGTKTLKHIANIVKNADATSKIKVTKTLNENTESKTTTQTIADLLGGVATNGTLITADVAIGVLTADTDAVFSFELVK